MPGSLGPRNNPSPYEMGPLILQGNKCEAWLPKSLKRAPVRLDPISCHLSSLPFLFPQLPLCACPTTSQVLVPGGASGRSC